MPDSTRTSAVRHALHYVEERLAKLPDSPEARDLRDRAAEYVALVEAWPGTKPGKEEREAMMRRVLALHIAAGKLGKHGA